MSKSANSSTGCFPAREPSKSKTRIGFSRSAHSIIRVKMSSDLLISKMDYSKNWFTKRNRPAAEMTWGETAATEVEGKMTR